MSHRRTCQLPKSIQCQHISARLCVFGGGKGGERLIIQINTKILAGIRASGLEKFLIWTP